MVLTFQRKVFDVEVSELILHILHSLLFYLYLCNIYMTQVPGPRFFPPVALSVIFDYIQLHLQAILDINLKHCGMFKGDVRSEVS